MRSFGRFGYFGDFVAKNTKRRFLITAGPTREYLDPVRFLTNGSTGTMGYACAAAAARKGHHVTLISGPTALKKPKGVKCINVISARDMFEETLSVFDRCDCVIMTAAICDYQPAKFNKHKIKKGDVNLSLDLKRTPDILAELGRLKTHQILIGFAVEDRNARQNAQRKLKTKNLDAVVLNSPSTIGASKSDIQILCRSGQWKSLGTLPKTTLANKLIVLAQSLLNELIPL